MPVILRPEAFDAWLDPGNQAVKSLSEIIQTEIYTELESVSVSRAVNSAKNNSPGNINPTEET
jgi:putative SOS response-associated peptidase YedK